VGSIEPKWNPKIRQRKLRTLYYRLGQHMLDDDTLLDVGWSLYQRACDIRTVNRARNHGELPCPGCDAPIHRQIRDDPKQSVGSIVHTVQSGSSGEIAEMG